MTEDKKLITEFVVEHKLDAQRRAGECAGRAIRAGPAAEHFRGERALERVRKPGVCKSVWPCWCGRSQAPSWKVVLAS